MVWVPGARHTARFCYGVHKGRRPKDFVVHWLGKKGYNFLGMSYPLGMKNPVYDKAYPDFSVRAWGKQTVSIAKDIIEENDLPNRVILVGWSMAGRMTQSVNEAAKKNGLHIDFFVGLASTPPNPGTTSGL